MADHPPLIPPTVYSTIRQLVEEARDAQVTLCIREGRISGATVTYQIEAART